MKKFDSLGRSLSKDDQKKVMGGLPDGGGGGGVSPDGGASCSMTYQDSSGGWHTEYGSCAVYGLTSAQSFGGGSGIGYCGTQHFTGPVALSSNGGHSRCPDY